ncbi:MAG TPA: 2,3,4,5-tetrahydropyridine-2,6-dicarboxylate N-succinyltransferase, partial [Halococcus sp.]|nr:2,3,4,5-tetrahydropyridine-2,6-dicarboxylate N-succinyltransferase [Halococcus sp.]
MSLQTDVEALWQRTEDGLTASQAGSDERETLDEFLDALETGEVRAAEKRDEWEANEWVKQCV